VAAEGVDAAAAATRAAALEPPVGTASERFRRLAPAWRAAVIDGALARSVTVEVGPDAATVSAGGAPVLRMHRPTAQQLAQGLPLVRGYADLRGERLAEIEAQRGELIAFFAAQDWIDPVRTPATLAVLNAALRFAAPVTQRIKFAFSCPRPVQFSPLIQPCIPTPTHMTLPSGHATEAHLLATLIDRLAGDEPAAQIAAFAPRWRLATRIAVNRTVAGVHFAHDSAAGAALGIALGEHLAACGDQRPPQGGWEIDLRGWGGRDFHHGELARMLAEPAGPLRPLPPGEAAAMDPVWPMLWRMAREEWGGATESACL
jgi:hypothetical protein